MKLFNRSSGGSGKQMTVAEAMPLAVHANKLRKLQKYEEAIRAFDELLPRISKSTDSTMSELVVTCLSVKASCLHDIDRLEEAVLVCDELVRYVSEVGEFTHENAIIHLAQAAVNKAGSILQMESYEEAIALYDTVDRIFGEKTDPKVRIHVARALFGKAQALRQLGQIEEAFEVYHELTLRFGNDDAEDTQSYVTLARSRKADLMGSFALGSYESEAFDDATGAQLLKKMVDPIAALFEEAHSWEKAGRTDNTLRTLDKIIAICISEPDKTYSSHSSMARLTSAFCTKAGLLSDSGHREEAVLLCGEAVRFFENAPNKGAHLSVAMAMVDKANYTEGYQQQVEANMAVIRRFGGSAEQLIKEQVAMALANLGQVAEKNGEFEKSIKACDEVIRRYNSEDVAALQLQVMRALNNKALSLGRLNRYKESLKVCEEVIRRCQRSSDPMMQQQLSIALRHKEVGTNLLAQRR